MDVKSNFLNSFITDYLLNNYQDSKIQNFQIMSVIEKTLYGLKTLELDTKHFQIFWFQMIIKDSIKSNDGDLFIAQIYVERFHFVWFGKSP